MTPKVWTQIIVGSIAALGLGALGVVREESWAIWTALGFAMLYGAIIAREPLRLYRAMRTPFASVWKDILHTHIRFYRELDDAGRERFERNIKRLLGLIDFEAIQGAPLDDTTRLLAVAGAAVIVHEIPGYEMPTRRAVLIYPDAFDEDYQIAGDDADVAGMVHHQGPIVFSHRELVRGWSREDDAYNVSIHEWAHVIDLEDGFGDGVPSMATDVDRWHEVLAERLPKVRCGHTSLRPYAGTNEAELFAVAVEAFFESPRKMRQKDGELYALLAEVFGRDPLAADPSD